MPTLLFWNVRKTQTTRFLSAACREHDVDILLLAECDLPRPNIETAINAGRAQRLFSELYIAPTAVRMFTSLPHTMFMPVYDGGRVSVRNFEPPVGRELLIVAAHLPSKLHRDDHDQYLIARSIREIIEDAEKRRGHANTVLIGDFNMDPFETGMIAPDGFHGMMDRRIAERSPRMLQDKHHSFFYNPMWSRLGDGSLGPSGTYYYNNAGSVQNLFWNTFDQILLRPSLLPYYDSKELQVITSLDGEELTTSNGGMGNISDHLPIRIKLDIERAVP